MTDIVKIFDTTLRDGEQSAGVTLNVKEKLEIAKKLAELGVDIIEAGFPISSKGDFLAVETIANQIGKSSSSPQICALSRALKQDIDACWNAIKYAKNPRIHTFIATSDIHIEKKLKMTHQQVLDTAVNAVRYAKKFTENVEFSTEDAVRSDFKFLCEVIESTIDAGATTINIPDTVGYAVPFEFGKLIADIFKTVPNINKAIISVHCHNDLGLAVSNSIAAIQNGARQVECTINGIGERAGNASLEQIVMIIKMRKNLLNLDCKINTKEIYSASKLVSALTGISVQANYPIVGTNAFAHSSGIHQDGILKSRLTYEIIRPQDVGIPESTLILTARSGRHALASRYKDLGFRLSSEEIDKIFVKFKNLADKKKYVYDEDLIALVEEEYQTLPEIYTLEYFNTSSGTGIIPTATVKLKKADKIFQEVAYGDGPVDATYKAIDKITKLSPKLLDYSLKSLSIGKEAVGEVTVKIKYNKKILTGRGISTDIIEASAKAYLQVINRILTITEIKKKL